MTEKCFLLKKEILGIAIFSFEGKIFYDKALSRSNFAQLSTCLDNHAGKRAGV
jgi:hypothetical protein